MNQTIHQISMINPVTDEEAARLARPETLDDLGWQISATPATPGPRRGRARILTRRGARRRLLLGAPMAAALGTALAVAMVGHRAGHPPAGGQQALSFTTNAGGGITVIVRNPLADPGVYRAEFAAHHLDITLQLRPVSPSIAGTVFYMSGPSTGPQIVPITAKGKCEVPSGGDDCPVGVRIPAGFRGQAEIDFGRAARPGEKYVSTGSAFARGEAMHGMNIKGETVAQVLSQLRQRHITVADFNKVESNGDENVHQVPGGWYVYDAEPWAPGQVMLFVGATVREPSAAAPQPAQGAPTPSPSG
ncbi:MAG TPA: hypothetical protein VH589_19390 [Trebonia sp.]